MTTLIIPMQANLLSLTYNSLTETTFREITSSAVARESRRDLRAALCG